MLKRYRDSAVQPTAPTVVECVKSRSRHLSYAISQHLHHTDIESELAAAQSRVSLDGFTSGSTHVEESGQ